MVYARLSTLLCLTTSLSVVSIKVEGGTEAEIRAIAAHFYLMANTIFSVRYCKQEGKTVQPHCECFIRGRDGIFGLWPLAWPT